jgi:hypothetical protein
MNTIAKVTSDRERSWYEDIYVSIPDGVYPDDYKYENLRGTTKYKSVKTGQRRRKSPGHGGRDVPTGKSVVYVHVKDEGLFQNLINRTSRPHTAWKPLVEQALRDHGFDFQKLTWSQKAGCSCPCSPGFIVSTGQTGHDLWVTIEADEPQRTDDEEAAHRAAQLLADPTLPFGK